MNFFKEIVFQISLFLIAVRGLAALLLPQSGETEKIRHQKVIDIIVKTVS